MTSMAARSALTIRSIGDDQSAAPAPQPATARSSSARSRFESPIVCPACNAPPRATLRLANRALLLRCPTCLLGWWDWPVFSPEGLYDESYFQSAEHSKGYDDYASLEPSIRRTARGRLDEIERCFTAASRSHLSSRRAPAFRRFHAPGEMDLLIGEQANEGLTHANTSGAPSLRDDGPAPRARHDAAIRIARSAPHRAHPPPRTGGAVSRDSVRFADPAATVPQREPFILDIGCSTGVFLDEARSRGWRPHGLEVSEYAVRVARRRGLAVRRAAVEGLSLPPGAFDCITMWDVIEHLRDPIGVFAEVSAALKPGGVFALSTGDITSFCARISGPRWHLFNLPEHLFFYSPRALSLLLARAGLRVASIRREVSWYSADYLVERLAKTLLRRKWNAGAFRERLQSVCVPASLGDIVSVYASKA